jgi:hypothetical protein
LRDFLTDVKKLTVLMVFMIVNNEFTKIPRFAKYNSIIINYRKFWYFVNPESSKKSHPVNPKILDILIQTITISYIMKILVFCQS